MAASRSDALVLFGAAGDLGHKMIFPVLYALAKHGTLKVPVIGVASRKWSFAQLRNRVKDSIVRSSGVDNQHALHHLLSLLSYVSGDYNDPKTFTAIKNALGNAARPAKGAGLHQVGDQTLPRKFHNIRRSGARGQCHR
jgi:glucose-6-phosphate 1-dehydrogenase